MPSEERRPCPECGGVMREERAINLRNGAERLHWHCPACDYDTLWAMDSEEHLIEKVQPKPDGFIGPGRMRKVDSEERRLNFGMFFVRIRKDGTILLPKEIG